jgi:hypothetical protein
MLAFLFPFATALASADTALFAAAIVLNFLFDGVPFEVAFIPDSFSGLVLPDLAGDIDIDPDRCNESVPFFLTTCCQIFFNSCILTGFNR